MSEEVRAVTDADGPDQDAVAEADSGQAPDDWAGMLAEAAGEGAEVSDAFGASVFDVAPERWIDTLRTAHAAGLTFFDWLSAVDEQDHGYTVVAHIADMSRRPLLHLLVRTRIPRDAASLPTATTVYRGAAWHERETHEMFGITFDGHPNLTPLLLPDEFEGHPLRKDFVLAARAAKPWPGAKEPGEGGPQGASPSRRRMQPPGVPDPSWGPRPPGRPDEAGEGGDGTAENGSADQVGDRETGGTATDATNSGAETPAEDAATGGSAAKKTTKKATTEKAAAKKTTAKAPAKKTAKKTTKKAATKKPAAKKPAAKKTTKKAATKKSADKKTNAGGTKRSGDEPSKDTTAGPGSGGDAGSGADAGSGGGDAT